MKKLILLTILTICSLNANIIFDLQDQYFENSYKQSTKASLYDLKDCQISMTNIFQDNAGIYKTGKSGTISYKLKSPLENFTISSKLKMRSARGNSTSNIILTSSNGDQHVLSFESETILLNNTKFDVKQYSDKTINITIHRLGKLFQLIINGRSFIQFDDINFNSLKKIEFILNSNPYSDQLYDFTLISKSVN